MIKYYKFIVFAYSYFGFINCLNICLGFYLCMIMCKGPDYKGEICYVFDS